MPIKRKKIYIYFLFIFSLLNLQSLSKEQSAKKNEEINSNVYYEQAYKLAKESRYYREKKEIQIYKQKMEECLSKIKAGIEKGLLYLPPKSHIMGFSTEELKKKQKGINGDKYYLEEASICSAITEICREYLHGQFVVYTYKSENLKDRKARWNYRIYKSYKEIFPEEVKKEDLVVLIENYKIFIKFLQQILFSLTPPPGSIYLIGTAHLYMSYEDLAKLYRCIGEPEKAQIIEKYLPLIKDFGEQVKKKFARED